MNVNSNIYGLLFLKEYPPKMAVHGAYVLERKKDIPGNRGWEKGIPAFGRKEQK